LQADAVADAVFGNDPRVFQSGNMPAKCGFVELEARLQLAQAATFCSEGSDNLEPYGAGESFHHFCQRSEVFLLKT